MQASLQKIARSSAFALLAGAATIASAQERARVISATPIVQQVGMPQQVCDNQTVYTGQQTTGGGAVLGAVAGGAVGNAIGGGSGRAAATALGVIGGALLGNQIEGNGKPQYQNVQRCHTETFYENRTVGYNVVYEFAGRQYTTQMSRHPGTTIAVQVQPVQDSQPDAYGLTYSPAESNNYPDSQYQPYQQPYPNSPRYVSPAVIIDDNAYRSGPRQSWR
ncbi:MAG: glycine zipper 2TM domain-containing protein [Giesbergeria sp.]|nr:glycine zipper 2TM domain-containing protein [Giesbergeria sp.]MBP6321513.1 glycine zipper 2TM domain-containing protein [Giesbergeria sp.]MBP8029418.1 glycine zipper 2TM domain-containing protein [Giesbergeria sp.]MBP8839597.1 glycine zipper 2TM domain-containing protein [Giesbergeria sp.]